jgi:hypothetical protein
MNLKAYLSMAAGVIVITITSYVLVAWLAASVIASTIKSINNSCEETYNIESIGVKGDWFCGEKE